MEQGLCCEFVRGSGPHQTFLILIFANKLLLTAMAPTTPGKMKHRMPLKLKMQTRTLKRKRDDEDVLKLAQAVAELVRCGVVVLLRPLV